MGKPVDWKRLIKRAVARAFLSRPHELTYFFLHELEFFQLLQLIRASLAGEKYPEPTKKDIQNLAEAFPLPNHIRKQIKENGEDYEEVSFLFALQALMAETVQGLLDYIAAWAQPDIDRLTADYEREFSERNIEEQQGMDEAEKALLQQELDEAYERDDRYQIYWLSRYRDSGLPADQIALARRTVPKIMEVLEPVIEQFASPVAPSMSGARLSGPIPLVDRNYVPLHVGQAVRVRWAYFHLNTRTDEGVIKKIDEHGGLSITTDHPVPHFDREGFMVHEKPWIYFPAEYDRDRKVWVAASIIGGPGLGSMETFVEISGPKEWSPTQQVKWSTP